MERIVESEELMTSEFQCKEYLNTDRSRLRDFFVRRLAKSFELSGTVADLGCGPADYDVEISKIFPNITIEAIDGSMSMISIARESTKEISSIVVKHQLIEQLNSTYDAVISANVLHHFFDPDVFWKAVKNISKQNTKIFIMDLIRPANPDEIDPIILNCANDFPQSFKDDFRDSLQAAFTVEEIEEQLKRNDLNLLISTFKDAFEIVIIQGEIK